MRRHRIYAGVGKVFQFAHKDYIEIPYILPESMVCCKQKTNGVGQTDAAEISADKPTVMPVTGRIWRKHAWAATNRSLPLCL